MANWSGKRLNRSNGMIVNQYGVRITPDEYTLLKNRVDSAARKRRRLLNNGVYGVFYSDANSPLGNARELDFVFQQKPTARQYFEQAKSRAAFDRYVQALNQVTDRNYLERQVTLYRDNYISALESAFPGNPVAWSLGNKINRMDLQSFLKVLNDNPRITIRQLYRDKDLLAHLSVVADAWGGVK